MREDVERITRHDLKNPITAIIGLGTYSAKLIAQAHGASIAMTSSPTEGTMVSVRFGNDVNPIPNLAIG